MRLPADDWTESDFQRRVVALAHDYGWGVSPAAQKSLNADLAAYSQPLAALDGLVFHPRIMYRSEPGWPDLTLIRLRDRRFIFAELKRATGKLSDRQIEVLDLLCELFGVDWRDPTNRERWYRPLDGVGDGVMGVGVYVWRPSDLSTIHEVLR